MPKYVNRTTGVTVTVDDESMLPGAAADWEPEGTQHRGAKRRADTGSVPTQRNQSGR